MGLNRLINEISVAILLAALGLGVFSSEAAVLNVPSSYSTISAAMTAASDGDTVLVASGTYSEFVQLVNYGKEVYVKSVNGPSATKISGSGSSQILRIQNSSASAPKNVTFEGFTLMNGYGSGNNSPINIANTRPVFIDCIFTNNFSVNKGGAVLVFEPASHPVFVNCIFNDNSSDNFGGAVLVNGDQAQAVFKSCLFQNNSTRTANAPNTSQGGALNFTDAGGRIVDCKFIDNEAKFAGGAILAFTLFSSPADYIEIIGCHFEGNYALADGSKPPGPSGTAGGAVHIEDDMTALIVDCYFSNNYARTGGAISGYRSEITVRDSLVEECYSDGTDFLSIGGGMSVLSDDAGGPAQREAFVTISNSTFRNCTAPVGGGIYMNGDPWEGNRSRLNLNDVTIEGCLAEDHGGGTFTGNGGGLYLQQSNCDATNVYLLNNVAEVNGGAGLLNASSLFDLRASYIVGNDAWFVGDGIYVVSGTYTPVSVTTAYNPSTPTGSFAELNAFPSHTVCENSALSYVVAPYSGSPSISPTVGSLPNLGGFSAGTPAQYSLSDDTTYTMSSSHPDEQVTVTYTKNAFTNIPYNGTIHTIPVVIEAEDFDEGGANIAYRDFTSGNDGGSYRANEGVDLTTCIDTGGGYMVFNTKAGEFLEYTIEVPSAGTYDFSARVAASSAGGTFHVAFDGVDLTGDIAIPNTGGTNTWQTLTVTGLVLSAGHQKMCVVMSANNSGGSLGNFNYFQVGDLSSGMAIEKTVYSGHDSGASCPGIETVFGTNGYEVTYCFVVTNSGTVALTNVTVTDGDLSGFSPINLGTLNPGGSATGIFETTISSTMTNTATVTGYKPTGDSVVEVDTARVFLVSPGVSIAKTVYLGHDGGSSCPGVETVQGTNGAAITYCFFVENTGNLTLNSVEVSDPSLPGFGTNSIGTLTPGQSTTIDFETTISGDLLNTATVVGTPVVGEDVYDSDTAQTDEIAPSLAIAKTVYAGHDGGATCPGTELAQGTNGAPVTYCFSVTNSGDVTLTGVTITDSDLSGFTPINLGSLTVGQVKTASFETTVAGDLTNNATASGTPPSGPAVQDSDTAEVDQVVAAVQISKTVYTGHDSGASCPGGESVQGTNNSPVTYCFVVENTGELTLTDVTVSDADLAGFSSTNLGSLAAGQSTTTYFESVISGDLTNTATATGTPPSGPDVNDNDTAVVDLVAPSVRIDKTVYEGHDSGASCPGTETAQGTNGAAVTYCFVASNDGDVSLSNVTVTDGDVGFGPSNLGSLTPGQSVTTYYEGVISGDLVNTADVEATPTVGGNVFDSDTAQVDEIAPSLQIAKTVYAGHDGGATCPGTELAQGTNGAPVTYCFSVTNSGDVTLSDVTITDTDLPGFTATNLGSLSVGQVKTAHFETSIGNDLTNTATARGTPPTGPDVLHSDTAEVDEVVPAVQISKTVYAGHDSGASCPGIELVQGTNDSPVTYCFVVENIGDLALTDVTVTDADLAGFFPVNLGSLAVGQIATTYFETVISSDLTNTATATGTPPSGPDVNDNDTAVVDLVAPSVRINKTVYEGHDSGASCPGTETAQGTNGAAVTYCFVVSNDGDVNLSDVTVTDGDVGFGPSNLGSLAPGQSVTTYYENVISGDLVNTGTVSAVPSVGNDVGDEDTASVDEIAPVIVLYKTVYTNHDSGASCPGVELVQSTNGTPVTYCFVVSNAGDVVLADVTVTDSDVPGFAATNLGSVAPGNTAMTYFETFLSGDLTNTASVSGAPPSGPDVVDQDSAEVDELTLGVSLSKTVYTGHDGGASCPGAESAVGTNGSPVTYCFVASNAGDLTLTDVTVSDADIPGFPSTNLGTLVSGQSVTTYFETSMSGDLTNVASVVGTPPGGGSVGDSDTAEVIAIVPSIEMSKTVYLGHDSGSSCPGSESVQGTNGALVTYCFFVTNSGESALANVTVSDAQLTGFGPENLGTLNPGETATTYFETTISGNLVNTGEVTSTPVLGGEASDQDTASVTVIAPSVVLFKTVYTNHDSGASCPGVEVVQGTNGAPVTYCFIASNAGDVVLSNVTVTDADLPGFPSTNLGTLGVGLSVTTYFEAVVNGDMTNTATVSALPPAGPAVVDTDVAIVDEVQLPFLGSPFVLPTRVQMEDFDLGGEGFAYSDNSPGNVWGSGIYRLSEDVDILATTDVDGFAQIDFVNAGEWLEYSVSAPSGGLFQARFRVAASGTGGAIHMEFDEVPIGGSISIPDTGGFAAWANVNRFIYVPASPTTQIMRISMDTNGTSGFVANFNYVDIVEIPQRIGIQKTVYAGHDGGASCPGGELVQSTNGAEVTYCFVVNNPGVVSLSNVTLTDPDLAGFTSTNFGTLTPGQVVTHIFETVISGDLTNTAVVTGTPAAGPDLVDQDTAVVEAAVPAISLEKTVYTGHDSGASCPGVESVQGTNDTPVTYCFVVENSGDVTLSSVTITDGDLSGFTPINLGTLSVGEIVTSYFEAVIGGDLTNTATVTGTPSSGPDVNDNDTAIVDQVSPSVLIEKTVYEGHDSGASCPGTELAQGTNGAEVTYCFVVSNAGDVSLSDVTVTDADVGYGPVNLGSLSVGQSVTTFFESVVSGDLINTGSVVATPSVGVDVYDDDTAEVDEIAPSLQLSKTVYAGHDGGSTCPGSEIVQGANGSPITYCFVVTNSGDVTLTDVTIDDSDLAGFSATNVGSLTPGQVKSTHFETTVGLDFTNTATASGTPPAGPDVADLDTAEVDLIAPAIQISKTVYAGHDMGGSCPGVESIVAGNGYAITYCFEVQNLGDVALTDVTVSDATLVGFTDTNLGTLAVGQVVTTYFEATMSGSLTNTADVVGTPPVGDDVADADTAIVISEDSDFDGIVDAWEILHFGDLITANAMSDSDGEGFIDLHEYLAGTVPTNAASYLRVDSVTTDPSGKVVVTWQSESNRVYSLSRSTNLVAGFQTIATNLLAVPPANVYTDSMPATAASCYRVDLE